MASILDRYGIKEVADVTFYELKDGVAGAPVLYLDTLKVSTIEQTAESAEAKGGKGNPPLISWDYGKEITVTLEDALFSAKSMAIMFGNGTLKNASTITKTERFTSTEAVTPSAATAAALATALTGKGYVSTYTAPNGSNYTKTPIGFYSVTGESLESTSEVAAQEMFCKYTLTISGSTVEISANSFPDTYYVTGDTYARSDKDGKDEFFQFIIHKAKVQSENTITLEAEGDPSVFNMSLKVLRPTSGPMMELVKYDLTNPVQE